MITKEVFFKAYNAHPPNKVQILFYRYFGSSTTSKDKWLSNTLTYFWVGLVFLGFTLKVFNFEVILLITALIFVFSFVPFWIFAMVMVISNKLRLRKIRLSLKLTRPQYKAYATMFL